MRIMRLLVLLLGLVLGAPAVAQLLPPSLAFPLITFDSNGTIDYDEASNLLFVDVRPVAIQLSPTSTPIFFGDPAVGQRFFTIGVKVGPTGGLLGGIPDDDLLIEGSVDLGALGSFSGLLLRGNVTFFAFEDVGPTDFYAFEFSVDGGLLAFLYEGSTLGIELVSESSTFSGDFEVDFGGDAKGNLGGLPVSDRRVQEGVCR
jgi:hypothetical protein